MRVSSALRYAASGVVLGGVALLAVASLPREAEGQANFIQNGEAGYVVSDISYALSEDAERTGACPNGLTLGGNRLRVLSRGEETPEAIEAAQKAGMPFQQAVARAVEGMAAVTQQGERARAEATARGLTFPPAPGFGGGGQGGGQGQGGQAANLTAEQRAALAAQYGVTPAQLQAAAGGGQGQGGQGQGGRVQGNFGAGGPSACVNPDLYGPDINWRTVEQRNIPAYGIDLDGQNSTANGRPAAGTCAHDDFRGFNGERGIDNQFFRVVGCTPSFQSSGQSNGFVIEMLTGAWGIVVRLRGVDNVRNDNEVIVDISDNGDPIQLSPNREPLLNVTYAMNQDARFRATTRGRIVNGVLITEPVNVRFKKITNGVYFERTLDDARLRVTLGADGSFEGVLAGYTPVEDIYNFQFGMANGSNGAGQPRRGAGAGAAGVLGYTCNGAYHALQAAADGHRDPATGRCSAISTQYRVRAIPAFVVDAPTQSANEDLRPVQAAPRT